MDIKLENKTNETQAFRYYNVNLLQKLQPNEYVKLTTTDTTKDYYKTVASESGITVDGGDTPVQPEYNKDFYATYDGSQSLLCRIVASAETMSTGSGTVDLMLENLTDSYFETVETEIAGTISLEALQTWATQASLENITETYLDELATQIVNNVSYEPSQAVTVSNTVQLAGGSVYVKAYISHSTMVSGAGIMELSINNQSVYPIQVTNTYEYGPEITEDISSYSTYTGYTNLIENISATNAETLVDAISHNITEIIDPVRDLYEVARYGESGADYDAESPNRLNFIIYGDHNDANYTEILASLTMLDGYTHIDINAIEEQSIDWQGSLPTSLSSESSASITTHDIIPYDVDTWDSLSNYIYIYC